MPDLLMRRIGNGLLPSNSEADDYIRKLSIGQDVMVTVKKARNIHFHRKYFALLNFAFDYWEPPTPEIDAEEGRKKKVTPVKNFDRFRKDIAILCGYYDAHYRLNNEVRIEAKSISFAKMTEDEFADLYSKTIDVILNKVCEQYTEEELAAVVDQTLAFA